MSNNKQSSVDKEFAPYEEALALKELGFDQPCFGYFILGQLFVTSDTVYNSLCIPVCKAPTYSQAFRWFREKHNLRCQINYIGGLINKTTWWDISVIGHYNTDPKEWEMKYQPYEEAELACLRKLIEIANDKQ
jgi:hypothetical protein